MNRIDIVDFHERRSLPAAAGVERIGALLGKDATADCFHYCAPTHGGWGVIRTAMLVPEMYMLFVCPAACGRHGAIAAIEQGCKERVGYLCIEESEIVLGSYEDAIRDTLPRLWAGLHPKPRAFMIVVSCIDDLLGSDYEQMIAEFEDSFGIPFRLGRMNPISLDSKLPPGLRIQRDMYDFLPPTEASRSCVAHLGAFQAIHAEAEIVSLLDRKCGLALRHLSQCATFAAFQDLAGAQFSLVTRPEGVAAAANLKAKLGMPFLFCPTSFSRTAIEHSYRQLARHLNTSFDDAGALATRRTAEEATLALVGKRRIAIDDSATCSPFDLARALTEAGFHVSEVFAQKLPPYEIPALAWLVDNVPGLRVSSTIHHSNSWLRARSASADIAIGFTAGYLSQAACVVPVAFDEGMFGHHGMAMLLDKLRLGVSSPSPGGLEKMVRAYGLVV